MAANSNRRQFMFRGTGLITTLAVANTVVYAVGSAFKELDGSMVAGAKCAGGEPASPTDCPDSGGNFYRVCTAGAWYCSGSSWIWYPATCARNGPMYYDDCM